MSIEDVIKLRKELNTATIHTGSKEELEAGYTKEEIKELKLLSVILGEFINLAEKINK
jgi:hypothetical protein